VEFVRFPTFEKTTADLFSKTEIFELEMLLARNPTPET